MQCPRCTASRRRYLPAAGRVLLFWCAAIASPAMAQQPAEVRHEVRVTLRAFGGEQEFLIADPAGAASSAARVRLHQRDGKEHLERGYTVHAAVVIGSDRRVTAGALGVDCGPASGLSLEPVDGAPGFWKLAAPRVAQAAALCEMIAGSGRVREAYMDIEPPRTLRAIVNDPGYAQQWHLNNTLNAIADINAEPAWLAGFNGAGVTVGIVEGGFEITHPDLAANYNATASQSGGSATFHGTSVAGIVGAAGNNGLGGVGVAWGSKISKLIYGSPTMNANALGYRNDLNWVKNNSWGPADDGTVTYITSVELTALRNAVLTGRGGKGTILTWAAGNGGTADRIDYDPYASSRYVLPIGGIGDQDTRSTFNESGSGMFMVCQTSGNARSIYTTDYSGVQGFSTGDYTDTFGGTSAAAPLAAGAIACILQANPSLSWRDVQHVLISTARQCNPAGGGWTLNAAGRPVHYDYGLGAIDLGAAITAAQQWINVRPELQKVASPQLVNQQIPDNSAAGVTRSITVTGNLNVETVEVGVNVLTTNIGDLEIVLTSPGGTQSVLATAPRADAQDNLSNYTFTSRRHWDEAAGGAWTLKIADRRAGEQATWVSWSLNVYGSPCRADVDGSGFVDLNDFNAFVTLFQAGTQAADFDGSGFVDIEDFDAFVRRFEKGC